MNCLLNNNCVGDEGNLQWIFKIVNDFKAIRIGTGGDTTKLEDLYKQFTDFQLRLSFNSLMQGYQITNHV